MVDGGIFCELRVQIPLVYLSIGVMEDSQACRLVRGCELGWWLGPFQDFWKKKKNEKKEMDDMAWNIGAPVEMSQKYR